MKIAVIGGVAAGTSAAAKARRVNNGAEIVIFEKSEDISYAGCGLPYYISGVIDSRNKLLANTPEKFQKRYRVEVKTNSQVLEIDSEDKMLTYLNLKNNNKSNYKYDKLIIATGASPVNPDIPGIDMPGVVTLRTISDADRIKNLLKQKDIKNAVVVGAGLVGLEMAEAFSKLGMKVTVIEKMPQVLSSFSKEMAFIIEEHLKERNVNLILNDGVHHFEGNYKLEAVQTVQGKKIPADIVLLAVGISPRTELARKAGIELGKKGALKINQKMETSVQDVYAAGDCAESLNIISGQSIWMPLGSTANKQGRIAGENAAGGNNRHRGITNTNISKIYGMTAARTGFGIESAKKAGFNPVEVKIKSGSHAAYYPGMEEINLKAVFDKSNGQLLGAEVIGKKGVDKRIDVLSTAVYSSLTYFDLFQIDLAYAPPYSIPKDPVAILGMVAEKKLK